MRITLYGDPRTKKNSQRIIRVGKGTKILPSEAYIDYANECQVQLIEKRAYGKMIDYPVNIACVYYMRTRRKIDLTNLNESIHDILVSGKVLADDNRNVIASTDGSLVLYDKENPRVEITIERREGYEPW